MPKAAKLLLSIPDFPQVDHRLDSGFLTILHQRAKILGDGQLDPNVLWDMFTWLSQLGLKYLVVSYPEFSSDAEKRAFLEQRIDEISSRLNTAGAIIHPVSTVTLRISPNGSGSTYLLITSVDRKIDSLAKKFIARKLGFSNKTIKRAEINPNDGWDPSYELGIRPGIIGPFLPQKVALKLDGMFYLESQLSPFTPVEVALSVDASLITSKEVFEKMLLETYTVNQENFIP